MTSLASCESGAGLVNPSSFTFWTKHQRHTFLSRLPFVAPSSLRPSSSMRSGKLKNGSVTFPSFPYDSSSRQVHAHRAMCKKACTESRYLIPVWAHYISDAVLRGNFARRNWAEESPRPVGRAQARHRRHTGASAVRSCSERVQRRSKERVQGWSNARPKAGFRGGSP